jgi:DNA-binding NarL/FixJ family response regulator
MCKIKVVLVDDQQILLEGLKSILETDGDICVAAAVNNGQRAIDAVEKYGPDVVLMDIRMPEMNGVECTKIIKQRWPHVSVLVLTTFDDQEYIVDALRFGASGYLLKRHQRSKAYTGSEGCIQWRYNPSFKCCCKDCTKIVGEVHGT